MNDKMPPGAEQYARDGFCLASPLVPEPVVAAAREGIEKVVQGHYETGVPPYQVQRSGDDDQVASVKVAQPHYSNRAIGQLIRCPAIGEWVAQVTGARFVQAFAVDLFVKRATATAVDEGDVGWHQDSLYLRHWTGEVLTAWVAVTEVTAESSPLLYVRGSHMLGEICGKETFWMNLRESRDQISLPQGFDWDTVPVVLAAGGVSLHHRHMIHGSGGNQGTVERIAIAIRLRTDRAHPTPGAGHPHLKLLDDLDAAPVLFDGPASS
jgi:hypothetical protein